MQRMLIGMKNRGLDGLRNAADIRNYIHEHMPEGIEIQFTILTKQYIACI